MTTATLDEKLTSNDVRTVIVNLGETVDEIQEYQREDLLPHIPDKLSLRKTLELVSKFLTQHGFDYEEFDKNNQLELKLAHRTYKLANKLLKTHHESRDPAPILENAIKVFEPVRDNVLLYNMMEVFSETNSNVDDRKKENYNFIPCVAAKFFPRIAMDYSLAMSELEDQISSKAVLSEKKTILNTQYQSALGNFLGQLKDISTESYLFGDVPEKDLIEKAEKLYSELFVFDLNGNSKVKKMRVELPELFGIAKGAGVINFESIYGDVVGLGYSRNINHSSRTVTFFTQQNGGINIITTEFPDRVNQTLNNFVYELGQKAQERHCGGEYMNQTNKAMKQIERGFLTGK